jgi:heparanase 1
MGRPQTRMTPRMVIAVVATLITCLALLATQLEFDRRDPHEFIHHNKPHPRHSTPPPQRKRVKGETVLLKIRNKLVATTDAPYVCVSLDWWPDAKVDWSHRTWNASSVIALQEVQSELHSVLSSLHPVALRVGGTLQDLVAYEAEGRASPFDMSCPSSFRPAEDRAAFEGACVTLDLYDALETLAFDTKTPLIFGLSGLHGRIREDGKCPKCDSKNCDKCWSGRWSASSGGARSLLKRASLNAKRGRGALAAVSLGNELCGQGGIAAHLSPSELAADFRRLRAEIDALFEGTRTSISGKGRPYIIGPDCQLPLERAYDFYSNFNKEANVDALAFHLYWLGAGKLWKPFKKKLFDKIQGAAWPLGRGFYAFVNAYTKASRGTPLWITEAGGMYGSGGINVTSSFASAFWYLDELGESAKKSIQVHCRQALVGGHYGLTKRVGHQLIPRPDFYATKLWASLMGPRVLSAQIRDPSIEDQYAPAPVADCRAYAHCHRTRTGDVAIVVLNGASRVARRVALPEEFASLSRLEYHMTAPSDVFDDRVLLNGVLLDAVDAELAPRRVAGGPLTLAPASYVVAVVEGAKFGPCLG